MRLLARLLFAGVMFTTRGQHVPKPEQSGAVLLMLLLRHSLTRTLSKTAKHLRQTGWYKQFPSPGGNIVLWNVMVRMGQAAVLWMQNERLRDATRVGGYSTWSGGWTKLHSAHDRCQAGQDRDWTIAG